MATTTFVDAVTLTAASWFNDVDVAGYPVLSGVAGTNTITATGPANYSLASTRAPLILIPAVTNTGATTLAITPSGGSVLTAKNVFHNNAACTGGELVVGVPALVMYDGTQFQIIGTGAGVTRTGTETLTNKTITAAVSSGTWTVSGTWTIPAVTLGGTVSAGAQTITNVGVLFVGNTSARTVGTIVAGHGFKNATTTQWVASLEQAHATVPYGLGISYSGASPNGAGNQFIYCEDSGPTKRLDVRSDGGISNFSANNVNLSDESVKPVSEGLKSAGVMPALWEAHKKLRWTRFKYQDQSHDDWNIGYTAQNVQECFKDCAPWIVGKWEPEKKDSKLLAVYETDLKNITSAVVSELQRKNDALKDLLVVKGMITEAEAAAL